MAALVYFTAIVAVSVACYCVCRLFGYRPRFKSVSYVVANVFYFAPLAAMSLLIYSALVGVVICAAALVLHLTGDLESVKAWSVWALLPKWGWFSIAVGGSLSVFIAREWLKDHPLSAGPRSS